MRIKDTKTGNVSIEDTKTDDLRVKDIKTSMDQGHHDLKVKDTEPDNDEDQGHQD